MRMFFATSRYAILQRKLGFALMLLCFISSCRGTYEVSEVQSLPERGHHVEKIAENCEFINNTAAIKSYCNPKTSYCDAAISEKATSVLECSRAKVSGYDLSKRNLRYSSFAYSDLRSTKLFDSDLLGINGQWAKFHEAQAANTDFSHAILIGSEFQKSHLHGALFLKAELLKARFDEAELNQADFHSANLRGASFMSANLKGASFINAYLKDVSFRGASLYGVDFAGAQYLETVDFSRAKHLRNTRGLAQEILDRFAGEAQ